MAKIRINGEYFSYDPNHKPMAEMLALEKELKTTYGQWEDGLTTGAAQAYAGLVWLVWKRDGRDVPLEDILSGAVEVNLAEIAIEADAPDPTTSPSGKEASSTTAGATSGRSRKS